MYNRIVSGNFEIVGHWVARKLISCGANGKEIYDALYNLRNLSDKAALSDADIEKAFSLRMGSFYDFTDIIKGNPEDIVKITIFINGNFQIDKFVEDEPRGYYYVGNSDDYCISEYLGDGVWASGKLTGLPSNYNAKLVPAP